MADPSRRLPENVPGDVFVDETCIDCATCRHIAPEVFARSGRGLSYVRAQPGPEGREPAPGGRVRALMALVACPTASIGASAGAARGVRDAAARFPEPVAPDVFYCGFTSAESFGASSYLIRRPEGNVLVDSPRRNRGLLWRIRRLGGARLMFLTHRDDVADHAFYARELGCTRVIHAADVTRGTRDVERRLEGREPVALAPDLLAIPVPGHTPGSTALLFREHLFSGDHLWANAEGRLHASRSVCWYSWSDQVRSVEHLLLHGFRDVLPGHGRRFTTATAEEMHTGVRDLLRRIAPASEGAARATADEAGLSHSTSQVGR